MKTQTQKDLAAARHGMWLRMKAEGLLQNGHVRSGTRFKDRKKAQNKKACRKRVDF